MAAMTAMELSTVLAPSVVGLDKARPRERLTRNNQQKKTAKRAPWENCGVISLFYVDPKLRPEA